MAEASPPPTVGAPGRAGGTRPLRWPWRRLARRVWLALALGAALSALAAGLQHARNLKLLDEVLATTASGLAEQVASHLATVEYGLRGARGAVVSAGAERIQPADFRRYIASRDLAREFPGVAGFGFIRRVAPDALAAYAAAQRVTRPGFSPHGLGPYDQWHYVIELFEPAPRTSRALGLDIATEPHRREAADAAMHSGLARLSAPVTLVQAEGPAQRGLLALLPLYREGQPIRTPAEREVALLGWGYAPLRVNELLAHVLPPSLPVALRIRDVTPPTPGQTPLASIEVYPSPATAATTAAPGAQAGGWPTGWGFTWPSALRTDLRTELQRPVLGRQWAFEVQALPGFVAAQRLLPASALGLLGLLATALAALALHYRLQSQERAAASRAAEQALRQWADRTSDAMLTQSPDQRVTGWNRAAEQLFGWPAEQALGRPLAELIGPPGSTEEEAEILRRSSLDTGGPPFESRRRRRDGTAVDVSIAVTPLRDAQGRVAGIGSALRDIGPQQQLAAQLRQLTATLEQQVHERTQALEAASRHLLTILNALPSPVGYWDRDLLNRFANQAHGPWFGAHPAQLPGTALPDLLGPVLYALCAPHAQAALRGTPQAFEHTVAHQDGSPPRHALAHYLPDLVDGEVRGFYSLTLDVSELTRSRQHLAESQTFLESVGRVARVGGWKLEWPSRDLTWTRQTHVIHDWPQARAPSWDGLLALYPPPARVLLERALRDAVQHGQGWDLELPLTTPGGRAIWLRSVAELEPGAPAPDVPDRTEAPDAPAPLRLVGAVQDVTARRAADEALRRLQAAEAANQAKTAFLAHVSHEMRTPLNAVVGFTHTLLQEGPLSPSQQSDVNRIRAASRSLLGVINDLLDLTKIEAGHLVLDRQPFQWRALVQELHGLMGPLARARDNDWQVQVADEVPDALLGDAPRLRQVLTNLATNALKFTERGRVCLHTTCTVQDEAQAELLVTVSDTGIGIAPELQASLFQPFVQADSSTTRRYGGTGLGLSIVRRLVALMHGSVDLDSAPGRGTRVQLRLRLPRTDATAAARGEPGQAPELDPACRWLTGLRVLVADDHESNREVVRRVLGYEGAWVEGYGDGAAALAALQPPLQHDVVVMDVQMPVLDGLEATRRLRATPATQDLPVVGLTAGLLPSERASARAAGMDAVVGKPFAPAELVQAVRDALATHGHTPPAPQLRTSRPPSPRTADPAAPADEADRADHAEASPGWQHWPNWPGIDRQAAHLRLRGDQALWQRLLRRLLGEAATPFADAAEAARWPPEALARRLHQLRGSAAMLGADGLATASLAAEQALRAQGQGLRPALGKVAAAYAELCQGLAESKHPQDQDGDQRTNPPPNAAPGAAATNAPEEAIVSLVWLPDLRRLLTHRDLAALAQVTRLAGVLATALGPPQKARFDAAIIALDFEEALRVLGPLAPERSQHAPADTTRPLPSGHAESDAA